MPFPTLDGFGPTRRTLQLYSRALSGLARVHGVAHPNWWHISLRVTPSGLQSDNIPLPGGGILAGRLDLLAGQLILWTSGGGRAERHGHGRASHRRRGRGRAARRL